MKPLHILLFIISISFWAPNMLAQEDISVPIDTTSTIKKKYGLRLGVDLSKLIRTAAESGYSGFEVQGDLRFANRFYAAAEIGNETRDWDEENLKATTTGSYVKLGGDFNAYRNWLNMNNAIYVGLRYGFSTFSQELTQYDIYTTDPTFPQETVLTNQNFDGLTASWLELQLGVKTEVINNLFLSINLQLKRKLSDTKPDNFDNLIIPGFNRTYDFSEFGVGYGYTISYLIPLLRR